MFLEHKSFAEKKIKIRLLSPKDIKNAKKFQNFVNSIVKEKVPVHIKREVSLKEEKKWIERNLEEIRKHNKIFLVAENGNQIVGIAHIDLHPGRQNHVGELGISIRKEYRGINLGNYLVKKIIKLAKETLRPSPKMIRISVFAVNKLAIAFFKKIGFKPVARIPKQLQFQGKLVDEIVMLLNLKKSSVP